MDNDHIFDAYVSREIDALDMAETEGALAAEMLAEQDDRDIAEMILLLGRFGTDREREGLPGHSGKHVPPTLHLPWRGPRLPGLRLRRGGADRLAHGTAGGRRDPQPPGRRLRPAHQGHPREALRRDRRPWAGLHGGGIALRGEERRHGAQAGADPRRHPLTAALHGLPVGDYNPMQVKKAVSGYGWAEKTQVGKMVMVLLNLKGALPADAADAAAVAIGHLLATRRA